MKKRLFLVFFSLLFSLFLCAQEQDFSKYPPYPDYFSQFDAAEIGNSTFDPLYIDTGGPLFDYRVGAKVFHFTNDNNLRFTIWRMIEEAATMPGFLICVSNGYKIVAQGKIIKPVTFKATTYMGDRVEIRVKAGSIVEMNNMGVIWRCELGSPLKMKHLSLPEGTVLSFDSQPSNSVVRLSGIILRKEMKLYGETVPADVMLSWGSPMGNTNLSLVTGISGINISYRGVRYDLHVNPLILDWNGDPISGTLFDFINVINRIQMAPDYVVFFPGGRLMRGTAGSGFTNNGMVFMRGHVELSREGKVVTGFLAEDAVIDGVTYSSNPRFNITWLGFDKERLVYRLGYSDDPYRTWQTFPNIRFWNNGKVAYGALRKNATLKAGGKDIVVPAGSIVCYFADGNVSDIMLGGKLTYSAVDFSEGDFFSLNPGGSLRKAWFKKDSIVGNFQVYKGSPVYFHENGQPAYLLLGVNTGYQGAGWAGYNDGLTNYSFALVVEKNKGIEYNFSLYPNGKVKEGVPLTNLTYEGREFVSLNRAIGFYESGEVLTGTLAKPINIIAEGTKLVMASNDLAGFYPNGEPRFFVTGEEPLVLNGLTITTDKLITFYPTGKLENIFLFTNQYYPLNGKKVLWGSWYFSLYPDGSVKSGSLREDIVLNGIALNEFNELFLYTNGNIQKLRTKNVSANGIGWFGDQMERPVEFYPSGKLFGGQLLTNIFVKFGKFKIEVPGKKYFYLSPDGSPLGFDPGDWYRYRLAPGLDLNTNLILAISPSKKDPSVADVALMQSVTTNFAFSSVFSIDHFWYWVRPGANGKKEIMTPDGADIYFDGRMIKTRPGEWVKAAQ